MPRQIELALLPMGYSTCFAVAGDTVNIQMKEFLSSEDGNDFIARLEGVSNCFSQAFAINGGVKPSQVDHFLAIVSKDRKATVYCNELGIVAKVHVKKSKVDAGDLILKDDIADIDELELNDAEGRIVTVPDDCGVVLLLSAGWRKGLYYDYSVLREGAANRTDNIPRLFAHFYSRLVFQEMYSITDAQWERLIFWGWFPFIGLSDSNRRELLAWTTADREPPASLFEGFCTNFQTRLATQLECWKRSPLLASHADFLQTAYDRYAAKDYLSCISVLYPRIEGLLRNLFVAETTQGTPRQATMVQRLVERRPEHSVLLPRPFERYLLNVFFRAFDERKGQLPLSRHTVGHGISNAGDYNFIQASLGFMVIDQVYFYLGE